MADASGQAFRVISRAGSLLNLYFPDRLHTAFVINTPRQAHVAYIWSMILKWFTPWVSKGRCTYQQEYGSYEEKDLQVVMCVLKWWLWAQTQGSATEPHPRPHGTLLPKPCICFMHNLMVYLLVLDSWFSMIWRMVSPMIAKETRDRIQIFSKKASPNETPWLPRDIWLHVLPGSFVLNDRKWCEI